jgi:hypothetical protein
MAHVLNDTGRWIIDVNTSKGSVLVQLRWAYTWVTAPGVAAWDYTQKKDFHTQVDRTVWRYWSNRVKLTVAGGSAFAKRFAAREIPIDFDVKWVTNRPHWDVNVIKLAAGASQTSSVNWSAKKILLDTNDFGTHRVCNDEAPKPGMDLSFALIPKALRDAHPALRNAIVDQSCRAGFATVPHEFGHALGDNNDDEYRAGATHRADLASIQNIGTEIRSRHLDEVIQELNTMISGSTFAVKSIRV